MSTQSNEQPTTPSQAYDAAMRELQTLSLVMQTAGVQVDTDRAELALGLAREFISLGDSLLGQLALTKQGDI